MRRLIFLPVLALFLMGATVSKNLDITITQTPTPTPPPPSPLDLPKIAWEGGPAYWDQFTTARNAGWTDPSFFPIGVWFESVTQQKDIDLDKAAGLNTYVVLTDNSSMSLVRSNGMFGVIQSAIAGYGAETVGWFIADEYDMTYGPSTGYTQMANKKAGLPQNGRPFFANFGKGVMFWETDSQAAAFVNNYTQFVSNDAYWYTDNDLCQSTQGGDLVVGTGPIDAGGGRSLTASECHRSSNYGAVIERMRKLDAMDGARQPIWAFVEDGHPSTENNRPTITGPQIQGAVMSSLISGARGIIYFNHNFGGSCTSQHVLRDSCGAAVLPYVKDINSHIKDLASVLNTQSYEWTFNAKLDTMLKKGSDGYFYIFALQGYQNNSGTYSLALPTGMTTATTAQVLYENRTVPITGGAFSDSFAAEYSWHIYKIPAS